MKQMTNETLFLKQPQQTSPSVGEILTRRWTWKTGGALFGLGAGILSPLLGEALTILAWFSGSSWHGLPIHALGTALFVFTFPLLAFGAHCLDLIDRENKKR